MKMALRLQLFLAIWMAAVAAIPANCQPGVSLPAALAVASNTAFVECTTARPRCCAMRTESRSCCSMLGSKPACANSGVSSARLATSSCPCTITPGTPSPDPSRESKQLTVTNPIGVTANLLHNMVNVVVRNPICAHWAERLAYSSSHASQLPPRAPPFQG
jgi:hypothetical protein